MAKQELRFRDSYLIRIGVGMIVAIAAVILAAVVAVFFGYNPPAGPSGLLALFGIFFALVLIAVGIGRTSLRRRR